MTRNNTPENTGDSAAQQAEQGGGEEARMDHQEQPTGQNGNHANAGIAWPDASLVLPVVALVIALAALYVGITGQNSQPARMDIVTVSHQKLLFSHPRLKEAGDVEAAAEQIDTAVETLAKSGVLVLRPEAVVSAPKARELTWTQIEALNALAEKEETGTGGESDDG
jgi:hypothetical protein